ncbi:MAG: protein kinase [Planctomycetes bacterium]|nr:protein kinase [Planctomycetota bacterium]
MTTTSERDRLADLVARCILLLESGDGEAADRLLEEDQALAAEARQQLQALRECGLLRDGSSRKLPAAIGPYRVLELIGSGGMGSVYLAEQSEPVSRRVAVKVIRPGMDTREVLARFAVERQTLATLNHPNIAKVYDAGTTEAGHPYLVMEYVAGEPLADYCDRRRLSLRLREQLMIEVCETVQHAHNAGILHRDLKPSNILVVDEAGRARPKIIDFGVAKWTQPRLQLVTLLTQHGRLLGTPEYMSPEQAGHRVDIDSRSDVYSLGVILFELVSGCLPTDSEQLRKASHAEVERMLHERPAPAPSARFRALAAERAATVAAARGGDPRGVCRGLQGELDWICLKALEKDRNRRYRMPADLAADLQRHLVGDPVLAGPPSAWYRFRCFAVRHRLQVAAAAMVLLSIVVGLIVSLTLLAQVHDEAERAAVNERWATEAVNELLTKVAEGPLAQAPGAQPLRRDLLLSALRFQQRFAASHRDDPARAEELARAHSRVGLVQSLLGDHEQAMISYGEAVAVFDRLIAIEAGRLELRRQRGGLLSTMAADALHQGDHPAAQELLDAAEAEIGAVLQENPRDVEALRVLGQALTNRAALAYHTDRSEDAIAAYRRALGLSDRLVSIGAAGDGDRTSQANRLLGLAVACLGRGRCDDAERYLQQGHAIMSELVAVAPADRNRRDTLANLASIRGNVADRCDRHDQAIEFWQSAAETWRRLTDDFPNVPEYRHRFAGSLINIANGRSDADDATAAMALLDDAIHQLRIAVQVAPRNAGFQQRLVMALVRRARLELEAGPAEGVVAVVDELLELDTPRDVGRRGAAEILCRQLSQLARAHSEPPADLGSRARSLVEALVGAGELSREQLAEEPWCVTRR